jgi:outer membrane biosynthesis protein TonB
MAMKGDRYTSEELMTRLKFIVGLSLAFTLTGIVFVVLYSLMFIEQPMTQSPNDAKFFELVTPIATFLTGILSGIMLGKDDAFKKPETPRPPVAEAPAKVEEPKKIEKPVEKKEEKVEEKKEEKKPDFLNEEEINL